MNRLLIYILSKIKVYRYCRCFYTLCLSPPHPSLLKNPWSVIIKYNLSRNSKSYLMKFDESAIRWCSMLMDKQLIASWGCRRLEDILPQPTGLLRGLLHRGRQKREGKDAIHQGLPPNSIPHTRLLTLQILSRL